MFDFGAHTCRAGFAGEDTPKVSTFNKINIATLHHPVQHLLAKAMYNFSALASS